MYINLDIKKKYSIVYMSYCLLFTDIYENRFKGIFKLLDDTGKMQCQTAVNFVQNIFANWPNNPILAAPKPREIQQNAGFILGFIIRHFVGDVFYNVVSAKKMPVLLDGFN